MYIIIYFFEKGYTYIHCIFIHIVNVYGLFGRWMAVKVEQLLQVLPVPLPVHHEKVAFFSLESQLMAAVARKINL